MPLPSDPLVESKTGRAKTFGLQLQSLLLRGNDLLAATMQRRGCKAWRTIYKEAFLPGATVQDRPED